jgi:hypothetical protein
MASKNWLLTGNAGTNPNVDFLGTKDNRPLVLKTVGLERLRVGTNGDIGIGTTSPDAPLNLSGGNWDLTNTEGDLKIGNDQLRLKMGVALGGLGAGDGRIRTTGGTNRLMIGTGTDDTVTIVNGQVSIGTSPDPNGRLTVLGLGAQAGGTLVSAGVIGQVTNLGLGYGSQTAGVRGINDEGHGVQGQSDSWIGTEGTSNSGIGVYAEVINADLNNWRVAGFFQGPVLVQGFLSKPGGGFRIDHPADPANKYLNHSFVESSEMKNIYDGIVLMDAKGEATVALPNWLEELNGEFRYQLTPIGAPAPQLHVAQEIGHGSFRIAGGTPGQRVSWQVTGIRKDAWAQAHTFLVEEEKRDSERSYYLYPELFGQKKDRAILAARFPNKIRGSRQ